ncbi:unnamed protein product [Schistosoma curassoni]|uniref:C2 domain-containing protein n=1 Tax=Schistosoma curassoni TaxID=6186 RepID=A0A183JF36_9TREM|nr:unnamed protein product [Schistosoma curassoni]
MANKLLNGIFMLLSSYAGNVITNNDNWKDMIYLHEFSQNLLLLLVLKFVVIVIEARLESSDSSLNTYISVKLRQAHSSTQSVKGTAPKWNEEFIFETERMDGGLLIEIHSKGLLKDKLLGVVWLPLNKILHSNKFGNLRNVYPIHFQRLLQIPSSSGSWNAFVPLPILIFTSASEPPCSSLMLPRYVEDSTSSRVSPSSVIGLPFSVLYLRTLVFHLCMLRPTDAETAATLAVFICICSCVCDRRCRGLDNPVDYRKKEEGSK